MIFEGELGSLEINIYGRSYPAATNKEDASWFDAEIKIEVSGFKAYYKSNLHLADLQQFYSALLNLENQTTEKAIFSAIEDDLDLELMVGKRGQVLCEGIARYEGNSLKFKFETDLFTINKSAKRLGAVLQDA